MVSCLSALISNMGLADGLLLVKCQTLLNGKNWVESCRYVCNGCHMNRAELRSTLEAEGIRSDAYDLSGAGENEAYVLREEPSGWCVFYRERGRQQDVRSFETEAEACECLFARLRSDPTTL